MEKEPDKVVSFGVEARDEASLQRIEAMIKRQHQNIQDLAELNPVIAGFFRFFRELAGGSIPEFLGFQLGLHIMIQLIKLVVAFLT